MKGILKSTLFLLISILLYSNEKQSTSSSAFFTLKNIEKELNSKKYDLEFFIDKYTIPDFLKKDLNIEIDFGGKNQGLNYIYENKHLENSRIELNLNDETRIKYMYKKNYRNLLDIFNWNDTKKKNNHKNKEK